LNKEFDTTKSALFNFFDTWLEPARFCADVQYVMALRMMRLALGGPPAATETWQMVSEKVSAFEEAQVAIVDCLGDWTRPLCRCRRGLRTVPARRARQPPQAGLLGYWLVSEPSGRN
jgi:hypothetical protein